MIDTFNLMMQESHRYPLLTAEQEVMLSRQVRDWLDTEEPTQLQVKRGQKAKNRLIQSNLRLIGTLVLKNTRKIAATMLDREDLFQAGVMGLNRAAEKFDATRGYKFSTYSYWWILQAVNKEIECNKHTIRVGVTAQTIARRWKYKPQDQSLDEFCEQYKYKPQQVTEYLTLEANASCTSLDRASRSSDSDSSSLIEILPVNTELEDECKEYEDAMAELQSIPEIKDALALCALAQDNRQKDIAPLLGCSKTHVRNQITNAKALVREHVPRHVRELIVGPERKRPYLESSEIEITPVKQAQPERVLVVAGDPEPSLMSNGFAPTQNGHSTDAERLERLVDEIQGEPETKPKRRRGRQPKAETAVAAPVASQEILEMVMNDSVVVRGSARGIAELIHCINE